MLNAAETIRAKQNRTESTQRVNRYRQTMEDLGMVQINFLVPESAVAEMKFVSEKKRIEYFLELCDLEPNDKKRQLLSMRNSAKVPTYADIGTLKEKVGALPLKGELKELSDHVAASMRAQAAMQTLHKEGGEDEEFIKWSSLVVAHSHAARYYHEYIQWRTKQ